MYLDAIYEASTKLTKYQKDSSIAEIDLSQLGTLTLGTVTIEIVDSVEAYVELMKEIFNFKTMKEYLASRKLKCLIDGMHGVTGPYIERIFVHELGLSPQSIMNYEPKEDFNRKYFAFF